MEETNTTETLKIKFKNKDFTKLVQLKKSNLNWPNVCDLVTTNFHLLPKSSIKLKYMDSEEDTIDVNNEHDL